MNRGHWALESARQAQAPCRCGLLLERLRARNAAHAVAIGYQAGLLQAGDPR